MNLRKDHSHMFENISMWITMRILFGDIPSYLLPDIHGWWFGRGEEYTCLLPLPHQTEIHNTCPTSFAIVIEIFKIFSDGCLGSNDDEGRSEVR